MLPSLVMVHAILGIRSPIKDRRAKLGLPGSHGPARERLKRVL